MDSPKTPDELRMMQRIPLERYAYDNAIRRVKLEQMYADVQARGAGGSATNEAESRLEAVRNRNKELEAELSAANEALSEAESKQADLEGQLATAVEALKRVQDKSSPKADDSSSSKDKKPKR